MRRPLLLLAALLIAFAIAPGHARSFLAAGAQSHNDAPPTDAECKALIARTIANQHTDDAALQVFERVEHRMIHDHDISSGAGEDRTLRIIPTGIGAARITLGDHGHPTDGATIQAQMLITERMLEFSVDDSNPQTKASREKVERRIRDRKDLVATIHDAFIFTWVGRETRGGRTVSRFHLDPDPNYKPTSRNAEFLRHANATAWVDEKAAQVVRLEAVLTTDISFIAGIAGKVYRDGRAVIEQSEVEPGIWLPSLYQYDFTLRKFLFTSEIHDRTEASHYQRIGPPAQALLAIRREISGATAPRAQ